MRDRKVKATNIKLNPLQFYIRKNQNIPFWKNQNVPSGNSAFVNKVRAASFSALKEINKKRNVNKCCFFCFVKP